MSWNGGSTWRRGTGTGVYDEVAIYRMPVILCVLVGNTALFRHWMSAARTRRAEAS
ncbi:MAG TPA: hypothetical protein VJG13_03330 [Thermoanaerobaculia bacterium]|nr:hypothetical protein [Thermoanaerobaculia bacterium]